ncbi:MAG: ABC transporter ATP-binding protein [Thermomonas sp.]
MIATSTNPTRDPPVVRCRGLTKVYGDGDATVLALRGVDLDVQAGELLMLVGPSGCGKTTLVSIITAILDPDGGTCEVLGEDMLAMNMDARSRFRGDNIGFVFQAFNLLPALTAVDNIAVPLLLQRMDRRDAERRSRTVLEEVGLAGRADTLPSKLSGGQQQRVAIGRALVHGPGLIVCDEPTSSLDAEAGHQMMELLRDVARTPERALIVVTHDNRIFDFADRIAHMEDGRIVDITANHRPGASV